MLKELEAVVREAGQIALKAERFSITEKSGHANFVTDVDVTVQNFLFTKLSALLPEANFIAEEKENDTLPAGYAWIVDPIDGTTNYIHDYHLSAVSVALFEHYEPLLACIYNPFTEEMFCAEKGKGTYLNGKRITVSSMPFDKALVAFGTSPYYGNLIKPSMDIAFQFVQAASDVRRCGSAALDLAYVAAGRAEVFFELNLKPWDFAAGSLLVTEAGGVFSLPMLSHNDYNQSTAVLASNALCFSEANQILQNAIRQYSLR